MNDTLKSLLKALIPLLLLGVVVYSFLSGGPTKMFQNENPPVEIIHVLRHTLSDDLIELEVVNSGTDSVYIAQVMVRGAFWNHKVVPGRQLDSLETASVIIPFPWNAGEPIEILLVTSTGLTFDYEIEVASNTPETTLRALLKFATIGLYVGILPVALGICWFPFLRKSSGRTLGFLTYFTVGLLIFLTVGSAAEGIEATELLPESFGGTSLFMLGFIGTFLILFAIDKKNVSGNSDVNPISWTIALGIGVHNLGEGLAIGAAYVLGEITLGSMLIVGFIIHNFTEGVAIITPILRNNVRVANLVKLGLLAGAPAIIGCWIGVFTYSQIWSVFFLGVGTGALLQVIIMILKQTKWPEEINQFNIVAVITGYLLMYATSLLVGIS